MQIQNVVSCEYIYCFELFQDAADNHTVTSDCGASGDVIFCLTHDIYQSDCKIYIDNYFSNIQLVLKLKALDIWYVEAIGVNKLMGAEKQLKSLKDLQNEGRGSSLIVSSLNNITITWWIDNSSIHIISLYCEKTPEVQVMGFCWKEANIISVNILIVSRSIMIVLVGVLSWMGRSTLWML